MKRLWGVGGLLLAMIPALVMACSVGGVRDPGNPGEGGVVHGKANVETVEVIFLESFPLQVHVLARGTLADGCTEVDAITTERDDNRFSVTITTVRPKGALCAQVEMPFEESVPLEVYGLPAGEYKVEVNGIETSFSFLQDNILPAE